MFHFMFVTRIPHTNRVGTPTNTTIIAAAGTYLQEGPFQNRHVYYVLGVSLVLHIFHCGTLQSPCSKPGSFSTRFFCGGHTTTTIITARIIYLHPECFRCCCVLFCSVEVYERKTAHHPMTIEHGIDASLRVHHPSLTAKTSRRIQYIHQRTRAFRYY